MSSPSGAIYAKQHLIGATKMRKPRRLDFWIEREYTVPSFGQAGDGKGSRRLFSGEDVLRVGICCHLADWGVPVETANKLAEEILHYGDGRDDYAYFVPVVAKDDGYDLGTDINGRGFRTFEEAALAARPGEFDEVLFLNVAKIASEIKAHLESLVT
jgi:hypothetical protein